MYALLVLIGLVTGGHAFDWMGSYYCAHGRDVTVHLFEWKWSDIARECSWLAEAGYCAVQVGPSVHNLFTFIARGWPQRQQEMLCPYTKGFLNG